MSDSKGQEQLQVDDEEALRVDAEDASRVSDAGAAGSAGAVRKGRAAQSRKSFPFSAARGLVALAAAVIAVLGFALRFGTGSPSAFGIDQIALICPLGSLEAMLGAKEFMLHPVLLLLAAVVVVLVAGKAFCSWVCPVPWVRKLFRPGKKGKAGVAEEDAAASEAAGDEIDAEGSDEVDGAGDEETTAAAGKYSIASELATTHSCSTCGACEALKKVGGKRDGVQIDSRHIVLLGALGSAAVFGFPVFCLICPVGLTFAFFIGIAGAFQFNEPSWALLAAPVIVVLEVVVLRKWCVRFCPISALISLISAGNRTFKPKVDEASCLRSKGIDCHACVDVCPEQVDPHSKMIPECSKCGACVNACPAKAISIKALRL